MPNLGGWGRGAEVERGRRRWEKMTRFRGSRKAQLGNILPFLGIGVVGGGSFALSARTTVPPLPGLSRDTTAIAGHLAVYGLLAATVWWSAEGRVATSGRRLVLAFLLVMTYGVIDEIHQRFVPGRTASTGDLVVDAVGAIGVLLPLWWRERRACPQRERAEGSTQRGEGE